MGSDNFKLKPHCSLQVFEYHWHDVITYDVMLVLLSFIIAWGEAWFFDFRMIPLEAKVLSINIIICVFDLQSCEFSFIFGGSGSNCSKKNFNAYQDPAVFSMRFLMKILA